MKDGPTMTKLLVLMASMTILYILFILPIMGGSYMAMTGGDFNTVGSLMKEKLYFIY